MAKKVKTTKKAAVKKTAKKKTAKKAVAKKKAAPKAVKKATKASKPKATSVKKVTKASKTKATPVKKVTKKKTVKKAVAKKKVAPVKKTRVRKVSRRRKSVLGKKELVHFRELLIEKLKEISGDVNQIETEALKTSLQDAAGNLSSMPIHMADIGSDNYEQEFALGLMDSERKIVMEIHAALDRIGQGTYGICEGTGEEIPTPRLEGIPWTRYCIQYAEMVEKGLVVEGEHLYDEEEDEDDFFVADEDDNDDDDDKEEFIFEYINDDEI